MAPRVYLLGGRLGALNLRLQISLHRGIDGANPTEMRPAFQTACRPPNLQEQVEQTVELVAARVPDGAPANSAAARGREARVGLRVWAVLAPLPALWQ